MQTYSTGLRLRMVAWTFVVRTLFIAAVLVVALLPGLSTLLALVIVSSVLFVLSTVNIMAAGRHGNLPPGTDPPGGLFGGRTPWWPSPPSGSAGDRFPRRPPPSSPSGVVERRSPTG